MTWTLSPFALAPALLLAAACGNTTVTLELTDAPPDMTKIEHVFITLERVEVHVAGNDDDDDNDNDNDNDAKKNSVGDDDRAGWRTVPAPDSTFDLVALQNDVRASLGELELPSGKITQIRLFMALDGRNEVVLVSGDTCALDLEQVPTTGIKINHPFKAIDVEDSSKINLVVDFDLAESVDQIGACEFRLKPVIKLKHVEKD
jgi:hypothetical protein